MQGVLSRAACQLRRVRRRVACRAVPARAAATETVKGALGEKLRDESTFEAQYLISNYHRAVQDALNLAEFEEALASAQECLNLARRVFGEENAIVASAHNNLGLVNKRMGKWQQALADYTEAVRIYEAALGPTHSSTATAFTNLAILHRERAELDDGIDESGVAKAKEEALAYAEEALSRRERALEPSDPDIAMALMNVAAAHRALGSARMAKRFLDRALPILESAMPANHPYTATCVNNIGLVMKSLGDHDQAMTHYQRALSMRETTLGELHPDTLVSLHNIAELLAAIGKEQEANEVRKTILDRQNEWSRDKKDPRDRYVEGNGFDEDDYDDDE